MNDSISGPCASNYSYYMANGPGYGQWDSWPPSGFCKSCYVDQLTQCILDTFADTDKLNMQSADILLGVLPTIIALIGNKLDELSLLATTRPLLAFLLICGSPTVNPSRAFDFQDPTKMIALPQGATPSRKVEGRSEVLLVLGQYFLASAAVANMATIAWLLGVRAINNISEEIPWLPAFWMATAPVILLAGLVAFKLRVKIAMRGKPWDTLHVIALWRYEFRLSSNVPDLRIETSEEGMVIQVASFIVSLGAALHLIFGTLILSSLVFVMTVDAITLAVRCLASTLVCRLILANELRGMRRNVVAETSVAGITEAKTI